MTPFRPRPGFASVAIIITIVVFAFVYYNAFVCVGIITAIMEVGRLQEDFRLEVCQRRSTETSVENTR